MKLVPLEQRRLAAMVRSDRTSRLQRRLQFPLRSEGAHRWGSALEMFARECGVDDDNFLGVSRVGGREESPLQQRYAQGAKVFGCDFAVVGGESLGVFP